ncbi:hypothetical protein [Sphingomonas desiccabilis]|uniref:Uncharacterized protein n=1 Tax=Sphingomonas desiccabilis TaxID=429134 RepID=A0A4Q2IZP0_9SPHN|nr:hypothetical protein [Sphingomonas desiccabilis]MBB3910171.1 hypothetical protein [Sphingomonas desiccabilis]RXZ34850.1 hypothetical protein EO081_04100 [Sphingomonas desiccabilis]
MNPNDTTPLILDLRDRMARIETKLDGHNEAHITIDRRLDKLEATQEAQAILVAENRSAIETGKARVATVGAIAGGLMAVLTFLGDHFWNILG